MKIVTVTNQKGGAGKTTTVDAMMACLSDKGFKVLTIDLDPQCNLTFSLNADLEKNNILDVLTREAKIDSAVQNTRNGFLIAGAAHLSRAESILSETGKEYRLKEALEQLSKKYDYILIDTPPALGILTINALTACDSIIIPAQADIYSIQGIERLAETLKPVRQYTNKKIKTEGILLTRYNDRTVLSKTISDIACKTAEKLESKVFKSTIREATAIKEAQLMQKSIFEYAASAKVTDDYRNFVEEFLK